MRRRLARRGAQAAARFGPMLRSASGSVAIIFALAIVPIFFSIGVATDYLKAVNGRFKLQSALDEAVLAAVTRPEQERERAAREQLRRNLQGKAVEVAAASFQSNSDGSFSGRAASEAATSFLKIIRVPTIPFAAQARALPPEGSICILIVDPELEPALSLTAAAGVSAKNCQMHVASNAPVAAKFESVRGVEFKKICVKGNFRADNGSVEALQTNCAPVTNPYAGGLPRVTVKDCQYRDAILSGSSQPGVYCGTTRVKSGAKLGAGLYVIKGGIIQFEGSNISGSEVTFYFADSTASVALEGGEGITLSAPNSGPFAGILMFQPDDLEENIAFTNGGAKWDWSGLIYTPSLAWYGKAPRRLTARVTLVARALLMDQISQWTLVDGGPMPVGGRRARLAN